MMDENSNGIDPNLPKKRPQPPQFVGKGFKPGKGKDLDPRIYRGGRPRSISSAIELREAIRSLLSEPSSKNKTKLDTLLGRMSATRGERKVLLEYGFGKVPEGSFEVGDALANKFLSLPADVMASSFVDVYRDIVAKRHTEYLLFGGRGSTKSSFVSLVSIFLLLNNPTMHMLAVRQVANTLRDSVFSQLRWAINELGLTEQFKFLTSPLEIEYLATHQKIYFRGADDPLKIKSIKPTFGYIGILWFEELDTFHGPEAVRSIEQSAIRGGDLAFIFKSFNPPKTANNWANKYTKIPKNTQYQHKSDYTTVPAEWLGRTFIEEAEHLKEVNPRAYTHEYLGEITGTGGLVFDNVELRAITDEEIKNFDRIYEGLDWGYALDPLHWGRQHYDAGKEIIYIYDEFRAHKMGNRELYEKLIADKGVTPAQLIIADSAEPKSIADMRDFGLTMRGAEKGPDSVRYSMRWLENRAKIIIDPQRCPHAAEEFLNYEFEQTKDGEFVSEYPDKDNHAIDETRYATNSIWKVRGK